MKDLKQNEDCSWLNRLSMCGTSLQEVMDIKIYIVSKKKKNKANYWDEKLH